MISTGELPQMKAPKIRNVYGVVGMLKLIAGKLSLCREFKQKHVFFFNSSLEGDLNFGAFDRS